MPELPLPKDPFITVQVLPNHSIYMETNIPGLVAYPMDEAREHPTIPVEEIWNSPGEPCRDRHSQPMYYLHIPGSQVPASRG